jgi:hypothetical protein
MSMITFVPVAPAAKLSFDLDGEPPIGAFSGVPSVSWEISAEADDRVRLSTGRELKDVTGYLNVKVGTASPLGKVTCGEGDKRKEIWGTLSYHGARSEIEFSISERYFVSLHVSRQVFDRLVRLTELGRPPYATISFPSSLLYGGEKAEAEFALTYPDAGGLEWDNKKYPHVEIGWCSFNAQFGTSRSAVAGEDGDEKKLESNQLLPPTRADLTAIQERVVRIDERLASFAGTVKYLFWVIVVVLIAERFLR